MTAEAESQRTGDRIIERQFDKTAERIRLRQATRAEAMEVNWPPVPALDGQRTVVAGRLADLRQAPFPKLAFDLICPSEPLFGVPGHEVRRVRDPSA